MFSNRVTPYLFAGALLIVCAIQWQTTNGQTTNEIRRLHQDIVTLMRTVSTLQDAPILQQRGYRATQTTPAAGSLPPSTALTLEGVPLDSHAVLTTLTTTDGGATWYPSDPRCRPLRASPAETMVSATEAPTTASTNLTFSYDSLTRTLDGKDTP